VSKREKGRPSTILIQNVKPSLMTVFSKGQVFLLALLAHGWQLTAGSKTCTISDAAKVDCDYAGIDQTGCESKGCCCSLQEQTAQPLGVIMVLKFHRDIV
jgi:hypothetical protein